MREAQLAFLLGAPASRRLAAFEELDPEPTWRRWTSCSRALPARPEMISTKADQSALRAEIDVARCQRRPDLNVQAQFTDELTNTGNPPFKAAIQLPLWDRGRIGGEVRAARALELVAAANVIQAGRQVELDVTRAYRQVEEARALLGIFETDVLPHTSTPLERSRIAYMAGTGTLLDILDAQRVYRQSSLDPLNAAADLARALAGLERAVAGAVDARPGAAMRDQRGSAPSAGAAGSRQTPEGE